MNSVQNYNFAVANIGKKQIPAASQPSFKQASEVQEVNEISNVVPDYNVKTPMSYKFIQDIELGDGLVAKQYKLANGQNVVIVPKDGPTVVKTYVNTGSFNEPDNLRGISHYIEHNLFNGSEDLGEKVFFDEVNKMGANTNASTSFSVTDYFISSNLLEDTDFENTVKLHAGMIQSPKFLADKLEKEKKIVNAEINMYMAEDESLGFTQTIKNLFNIKSSSLDLVAGTTDNITALTREDVVKYFNDNYYPANMTTVITGEVQPDEAMGIVSKYFTSNKMPQGERHYEPMIPTEKPVRQDIISKKSQGKASVFLAFAGPENNNSEDKLHLHALLTLAGGLANSRMTNLEIKYGTGVNVSPERLSSRPSDKSTIIAETQIPEAKVEGFLKDLYSVLDDLSKNPPTENELIAIKNSMKKTHNKMMEVSGALNNYIGTSFLNNNIQNLADYNKKVDEITAQDIANVAKKYLDLNKVALTVIHPSTVSEEEVKTNYAKTSSISFTGTNKKVPIDVKNVSKYRMDNNVEVVLNDINNENVTYNFTLSNNNTEWTPKKTATLAILSEMFGISGTNTQTFKQCSEKEDLLGIKTSIYATESGITQHADFPINSNENIIDYLQNKLKNIDLSQENFEKCLEIVNDRYSNHEVSVQDKYNTAMFHGTPYVFTAKEKLASLNEITLDDIKSMYEEIQKTSMGQVVVTGPFSKYPELKQQIFNSIGTYDQVKPFNTDLRKIFEPIEKTQVLTDIHKKNEAKIVEGFKFKQSGNIKDKACVSLLNEIFGGSTSSRLFMDLREKRHLAYAVGSNVCYQGDYGVMTMNIGTTTENMESGEKSFDNIKKSIDGFNENIKKITTEKVTQEELDYAKRNAKSMLLSSLETGSAKNSMIHLAENTPYGIDYINEMFKVIDSITIDDIYNTAQNVFASAPVYSIVATQASLDANKEFLSTLEK